MIKEYNQLVQQKHMHMEQAKMYVKKEIINKCNNIIKQCKKLLTMMMLQKNIKKYNLNWPQILDYPYRILIIGGSGSGKTNELEY